MCLNCTDKYDSLDYFFANNVKKVYKPQIYNKVIRVDLLIIDG